MQKLEELQILFNAHLRMQKFSRKPKELYQPFDYMISLGGKRVRPVLLLMACEMFGRNAKNALPQATAIELFHNFSLIHDDIMDKALMRRGEKSVHAKFGDTVAILSGDVMLVYAYQYLTDTYAESISQYLNIFNSTAIEVCEGQQLDMNFETSWKVTVKEYLKMIELKTAALLSAALTIGAIAGGAKKKDVAHLHAFGREIGIAFQLKDDLLDTFGDEKRTGKKTGGDILQNKKTFLFLTALKAADGEDKKKLLDHYQNATTDSNRKLKEVISIFNKLKIQQKTLTQIEFHYKKAMKELQKVNVKKSKKKPLKQIAQLLMQRNS